MLKTLQWLSVSSSAASATALSINFKTFEHLNMWANVEHLDSCLPLLDAYRQVGLNINL